MKLKPGDTVQVKEFSIIRKTLDSDQCYEGLFFYKEMKKFCGQLFTVLKKVNKIVDYYNKGIRKFEDVYILDGVHCEGTEEYPECDRMCFFFWKGYWLEKLN